LHQAIHWFSCKAMTQFIRNINKIDELICKLIQYHPSDDYTTVNCEFASDHVKKVVPNMLLQKEKEQAITLVYNRLQGISIASSLRGYLFEPIVHETLSTKNIPQKFQLSNNQFLIMEVLETPRFSKVEEKEFCDTNLSWKAKTYYKPIEKDFVSFDSFYYDDRINTLIGFQITVTTKGKQGFSITKVVDKYVNNNTVKHLWIIFVVPPDIAPNFTLPSIPKTVTSDEVSVAILSLPM